jgi:hypothetical protein
VDDYRGNKKEGAVTRAGFLRTAAAASAWWSARATLPPGLLGYQGGDQQLDRVSRVIETYDRQGIHRTGTDADKASAAWLLDEVKRIGVDGALEAFTLDRVDPRACFVLAGGTRAEGLPLFDGTFTSEAGISGRLGRPGEAAEIALIDIDQAGIFSEGRALADLRRGSHQAIIAVTRGAHPGLTPINAASFSAPFGVPVLQVSTEHAEWLDAIARAATPIRFVAHATRTRVEAQNVVASVTGRTPSDKSLPPIVVMTPRSGWWQCAAERGGGLACWLEAMRALTTAGATRSATFVASSGHELGHLGLESFINRRRDLVKGAAAWIHLGANIGAAGGRTRLQASDDSIERSAVEALSRAAIAEQQRVPRGTVPAGEARNIHLGGGRYVSLLGSSPYFHSQADRWPAAVDAPAVARYAAAMADLTAALASRVPGAV